MILVLRKTLGDNTTGGIQRARVFIDMWDGASDIMRSAACASVEVSNRPAVDIGHTGSSCEEGLTSSDCDNLRHIRELDVIQDKISMNRSSGRNIVLNEGGRIGDDCIDNGDSAHVSIDIRNVVRSIQMKTNLERQSG